MGRPSVAYDEVVIPTLSKVSYIYVINLKTNLNYILESSC